MAKKFNNKGRSNKRYSRSDSSKNMRRDAEIEGTARREARSDYDCYKSKNNDPRWYGANPQLIVDAASVPYSWPLGNGIDYGPFSTDWANRYAIPGVCAIYTSSTFGFAEDENSPINVAMRNVYSWVRHANAGHTNYDAPDLFIYLMAMDSAITWLEFLKRVYGTAQLYSQENRYYPRAVIEAMGVNFDDVMAHLNDFRGSINVAAVKIAKMAIPASMSFTARHKWMYAGLYLDSQQRKPQTYLFVPRTIWRVTRHPGTAATPGKLYLQNWTLANWTFTDAQSPGTFTLDSPFGITLPRYSVQDMIEIFNDLINPILREEDFNVMSGDILKAYGQNVYRSELIPENYAVYPEYNEEVLSQIENATLIGEFTRAGEVASVAGATPTNGRFTVVNSALNGVTLEEAMTADGSMPAGYLQSWPTFRNPVYSDPDIKAYMTQTNTPVTGSYAWNTGNYPLNDSNRTLPMINILKSNRIITMHHSDVTPDQTMVATRLTNIADLVADCGQYHRCRSLGSDVAHFARIWNYVNLKPLSTNPQYTLQPFGDFFIGTGKLRVQPDTTVQTAQSARMPRYALSLATDITVPDKPTGTPTDADYQALGQAIASALIRPTIASPSAGWTSLVLPAAQHVAEVQDTINDMRELVVHSMALENFDWHFPVAFYHQYLPLADSSYSTNMTAWGGNAVTFRNPSEFADGTSQVTHFQGYQFDVNNYAIVDSKNLMSMSTVALLSQFDANQAFIK